MKLRILKSLARPILLGWLLCLGMFFFGLQASALCVTAVAAAQGGSHFPPAVKTENFKKVLEILTLLKELFEGDDDAKVLQAAILKDPTARAKFPGLQFIFNGLDHSVSEMASQTNLGGIRQFSPEAEENNGGNEEAETIGIVKSYLTVLDIPFDTVKRKKQTQYLVVPDANGHPIQKLAHQVAESTQFRVGIDSDIRRIGYLSPGEKMLHLGLQALFLPDPRYSVVLQHELTHLDIMYLAGERFSIFGGALRSRKGTIGIPAYTKFFHLSELPASAAGVSVGLVNLVRLQEVWAEPHYRIDLVVDEIRSQLNSHIYNLSGNIELISSVVVRLGGITKLTPKVTPVGIQFSFENPTERTSRFPFDRGFISVKPGALAPSGTLTLQAGDISYDVPLPAKYRTRVQKLMEQTQSLKISPDQLGAAIIRLLETLRYQFTETVPGMIGSLDLPKIYTEASDRYLALDKILIEIKNNPASLPGHLETLTTYHEKFDAEVEQQRGHYKWSTW